MVLNNSIAETENLFLIKIEKSDASLIFQLTSNDQVMKYFPKVLNYIETEEMIEKILSHYDKYGYCFWKLLTRKYDFVGIAGLLHQELDGQEEIEISYRIKLDYWNHGYATEAAQACKKYAEEKLNKERIISIIHPENTASKRVAQKLGATKEKEVVFNGTVHDIYVY